MSVDSSFRHLASEKRFVLEIEGSDVPAVIDYTVVGRDVLDLYHTAVPPEHRGRGVAKDLAVAAFEHVKNNNLRMKLTCWYLREYLEKNSNPDYEALVVRD